MLRNIEDAIADALAHALGRAGKQFIREAKKHRWLRLIRLLP